MYKKYSRFKQEKRKKVEEERKKEKKGKHRTAKAQSKSRGL